MTCGHAHDAPALQFFKAVADIRPRHAERLCDLLGIQRLGRKEEQGMNLRDRAVNAPAGAHLAPVKDKAL